MKILVDVQGRICLPAKIRRNLGIEAGNYVDVNFDNNLGSILISKPVKSCVLCGKEVEEDNYYKNEDVKNEKYICKSCYNSFK